MSFLNSPDGYLGHRHRREGGHARRTWSRHGTERPDVGYWAEQWDPTGHYHPLFDSKQNDDGEWINVTTLPMLLAARPLYDLGGYRLALLLPMVGAIAAALGGTPDRP